MAGHPAATGPISSLLLPISMPSSPNSSLGTDWRRGLAAKYPSTQSEGSKCSATRLRFMPFHRYHSLLSLGDSKGSDKNREPSLSVPSWSHSQLMAALASSGDPLMKTAIVNLFPPSLMGRFILPQRVLACSQRAQHILLSEREMGGHSLFHTNIHLPNTHRDRSLGKHVLAGNRQQKAR